MRRVATPKRRGRRSRRAIDIGGATALVGQLLTYLSLSTIVPAAVALGYREPCWPFLAAGAISVAVGLAMWRVVGRRHGRIGAREGYLVVSVIWLLAAGLAALPYILSGDPQLDRPVDAYFEAMSGVTTTGASILADVEGINHSLLLWRQLTQWLGGMGIVVLALAVLPRLRVGGRQLLENDMPGPEIDRLADRIRDTARRLWLLYVGLTGLLVLLLMIIGWTGLDSRMSPFQAVAHALSTLSTGGFSTHTRSLAAFGAWSQWTITAFMVIAGANFAVWYRVVVRGHWRAPLRDEEMRLYTVILVGISALVAVDVWTEHLATGEAIARSAVLQVVSTMTTTGFASVNLNAWSQLALMTLVLLMFVGGCAGSTAGSLKVVRHVLLGKVLGRELRQTIHPEEITPIRVNGIRIEDRTVRAATVFILLYLGAFVVGAGVIAAEAAWRGPSIDALHAIAVSASALGNVGPGFGLGGPTSSLAGFGDLSTVTLTLLMWIGRLEIIPVFVLLSRRYWRV